MEGGGGGGSPIMSPDRSRSVSIGVLLAIPPPGMLHITVTILPVSGDPINSVLPLSSVSQTPLPIVSQQHGIADR